MAQPGPPQAPQPAIPPYPPHYPPPYGPPVSPYFPPPPKTTNIALIVIVVVIVVVLVVVGLAAILYLMVGGLLTDGGPNRPFVSFGPATVSGTDVSFQVASVTGRSAPIGTYSVNLLVNTTAGSPRPLATSFTIIVGLDTFTGTFTDNDGSGTLTARDAFRITANSGWRMGITYQFEVLWTDLSPVGFRTWTA